MSKSKETFIHTPIKPSTGSTESAEVRMVTHIADGTSELVISKTITERYPVQDYEKVMALYESLNRGDGRRVFILEEIAKGYLNE